MQWRAQFAALLHNFTLLHADHGSDDFNVRFRTRSRANEFLKNAIVLRAAIRIAGAVFRNGADVHSLSADCLRPAYGHGQKMGVAKWNVSHWNRTSGGGHIEHVLWNGNARIRQSGTPNLTKVVQTNRKPLPDAVKTCNIFEGPALALLGALAVGGMHKRNSISAVALTGNRRGYARVHPAAQ